MIGQWAYTASHQSLTGFDEHEDLCDEDLYGDHGGDVGGHHDNIG